MFVQKETICAALVKQEKNVQKAQEFLQKAAIILGTILPEQGMELWKAWDAVNDAVQMLGPVPYGLIHIRNQVFNGWPQK